MSNFLQMSQLVVDDEIYTNFPWVRVALFFVIVGVIVLLAMLHVV